MPIRPRVWRAPAALLVCVAVILAAVLMLGARPQPPVGPFAGIGPDALNPPARAPSGLLPDGMRVGVVNANRMRGPRGIEHRWRATACLTGLDLIGLVDVGGGMPFDTGVDQADQVGRWLGLASQFAAAERRYWTDYTGHAVLAAGRIGPWVRLPLPRAHGPGHHALLATTVTLGNQVANVIVAGVTEGPDRDGQVSAVLAQYDRAAGPAILLADLATTPTDPLMAGVIADPDLAAVSLDGQWVIARGFTIDRVQVCDVGGSDHPRLAADLRPLRPSTTAPDG